MKKATISTCQRCQSTFQCKADDIANCQCATVSLSKETQLFLKTTNYACLCKNCLVEINLENRQEKAWIYLLTKLQRER